MNNQFCMNCGKKLSLASTSPDYPKDGKCPGCSWSIKSIYYDVVREKQAKFLKGPNANPETDPISANQIKPERNLRGTPEVIDTKPFLDTLQASLQPFDDEELGVVGDSDSLFNLKRLILDSKQEEDKKNKRKNK